MEPAESVALAENALREAVRSVLPTWTTAPGAPARDTLEAKRAEDAKRRDGTLSADDLLAYTEIHHLIDLVTKNWEAFKPVFDDLARTKVFLSLLADYRNPVAHSRELVGFELDLLSGASGQLRQQVILYRTRHEPSSAHYPVIESVTDNFGQVFSGSVDNVVAWQMMYPGPLVRLEVGERVQFSCVGWDSQERLLTWKVRAGRELYLAQPTLTLSGRRATFTVKVGPQWVGEEIGVAISLKSPGPHHRNMSSLASHVFVSQYDAEVFAFYAVNPPRG